MKSTLKAVEKEWRMLFNEELGNRELDLCVRSGRVEWSLVVVWYAFVFWYGEKHLELRLGWRQRLSWPRRDVIFRAGDQSELAHTSMHL